MVKHNPLRGVRKMKKEKLNDLAVQLKAAGYEIVEFKPAGSDYLPGTIALVIMPENLCTEDQDS
jgi:malate/lactate dehydrogenase